MYGPIIQPFPTPTLMSDPREEIIAAEASLGYAAPLVAGGNSYSSHHLNVARALGLWMVAEGIVWGPSHRFWRAVGRSCYEPLCYQNELHTIATQDKDFVSTFPIATRMLRATSSTAWGECVLACGTAPVTPPETTFVMSPQLAFAHDDDGEEIAFYDPTSTLHHQ